MKTTIKFILVTLTISLTSCKSDPPKLIAASDVCNEEYKDEIVMCEGIVQLPDSFFTAGGSVTMAFEAPKGKYRIPMLKIKTFSKIKGEKKNMMDQLQDGYLESDVKIYDDKGQIIKLGDKIRVTGELVGAIDAWCEINVDKIEKIN